MAAHHPLFARFYARISPAMDRAGAIDHRRQLLAGLSGRVIEVGAGNGLNFAHYPPEVTEVVAVEPEPYLRSLAEQAADDAPVEVRVTDGVADRLPGDDARFDAAVASLVLCTIPDQGAALAELFRVVRPGGQLRFLEHVTAESSGRRRVQSVLDRTIWPRLFGGCHVGRDTKAAIIDAGFDIDHIDAFDLFSGPASRHILGTATRP